MAGRAKLNSTGYKSLAPIYFRNSNAAVIVYDITQVSWRVLWRTTELTRSRQRCVKRRLHSA